MNQARTYARKVVRNKKLCIKVKERGTIEESMKEKQQGTLQLCLEEKKQVIR